MTVAKTVLPEDRDPALQRWLLAGAVVILVHAAIVFWILYIRDLQSAGAPPVAIMIELAPMDVAPPTESPAEVTPGPQMTEAQPEEVEQQQQTVPVPELAPAPKPNVVLMPPQKPKPKPKKIEKDIPKPVVKREHEPPAPRTSAPPRAAAARPGGLLAGANAAEASAWRSSWAAALSLEQTLSGSGAGQGRTRHGSARPHDWPQRPCAVRASHWKFRFGGA